MKRGNIHTFGRDFHKRIQLFCGIIEDNNKYIVIINLLWGYRMINDN